MNENDRKPKSYIGRTSKQADKDQRARTRDQQELRGQRQRARQRGSRRAR